MSAHEHHPWCDTSQCILGHDGDGEYASHWGHAVSPTIDTSDCMPWRNRPEGTAEIQIRTTMFTGARTAGVEVNLGDMTNRQSTSGSIGVSWLTPAETRELAAILLRAADTAEATR